MKDKIIVVDFTYLQHQSIFSRNNALMRKDEIALTNPEQAQKMFIPPSTYTCMVSLISCLKKVGINDECGDKVILAVDGRHSWRKNLDSSYKGKRQEQRQQAQYINWDIEYGLHNDLVEKIDNSLPFFIVKGEGLEADDWIAEICKFFKDNQVIIISPDKDFNQLLTLDNVRIYSPHTHKSVRACPYRILDLNREKEKQKAYKSLMSKIRKETSDDLISEVLTEDDYDIRKQIVSLLELPDFVIAQMKPILEEIAPLEKEYFYPEAFGNGIYKKLVGLFDQDKIITYDNCRLKFERKLKKNKNKKRVKKLLPV